jgi:hypothetical protein
MKNIMRNVLIGVGLLVVVIGYTYFQVTSAEATANPNTALGSDMPLDQLTQNETLSKEKLSKTEVYLKDEVETEAKQKEFDKIMADKSPQRLTSNFEAAYSSEFDKKTEALKERDLTPGYAQSGKKASDINLFDSDSKEANIFESKKTSSTSSSTNSGAPKIMKSSVPTNRKTELETPKQTAKSDESYFNMSSVNDGDSGNSQTEISNETKVVKAAVMGNQSVKAGAVMRFRLLEKATFGGTEFARNTIFFAKCSFGTDRLNATVDKIPTKGGYKTIKLLLHDQDLMEGIYAPVKEVNEAAADETMSGVEDVLSSTGTVVGQAGSGLARIFRSSTNGQQKVSVTDAYPVLFVVVE